MEEKPNNEAPVKVKRASAMQSVTTAPQGVVKRRTFVGKQRIHTLGIYTSSRGGMVSYVKMGRETLQQFFTDRKRSAMFLMFLSAGIFILACCGLSSLVYSLSRTLFFGLFWVGLLFFSLIGFLVSLLIFYKK